MSFDNDTIDFLAKKNKERNKALNNIEGGYKFSKLKKDLLLGQLALNCAAVAFIIALQPTLLFAMVVPVIFTDPVHLFMSTVHFNAAPAPVIVESLFIYLLTFPADVDSLVDADDVLSRFMMRSSHDR